MNKKTKQIVIYFLLIFAVSSLPYFFCSKNPLQLSLDIVKTLSVLATSLFALLYFDPFGLKKKNVEKQYENVAKVLELVLGQRIAINGVTKDRKLDTCSTSFFFFLITRKQIIDFPKDADSYLYKFQDHEVLCFINDFEKANEELIKLKTHLWTPKTIAQKIAFPMFENILVQINQQTYENSSVAVSWTNNPKQYDNQTWKPQLEKSYTLKQLIFQYRDIINACETWLEKNSFSKSDFNL